MGNLYITVEEFMKQIGNSHVDVEPSVYAGAAMQISNASVSYDDEEEEPVSYTHLIKNATVIIPHNASTIVSRLPQSSGIYIYVPPCILYLCERLMPEL